MFKRPTSRRKTAGEQIQINLVPILDTMVTLIAFMLFTMAFFQVVSVESPLPVASTQQMEQRLKEKPLQLTVSIRDGETEIWSPFGRIAARRIAHVNASTPNNAGIHQALLEIKKSFPTETKAILVPTPGITYDVLVSVMDAVRVIEATDPPVTAANPKTGVSETSRALFPEIIFGNLLEGD